MCRKRRGVASMLKSSVAPCRSSIDDLEATEDGGEARMCCTGSGRLPPCPWGEAGCAVPVTHWQAAQDPEATRAKGWGGGTPRAGAARHAVEPPSQTGKSRQQSCHRAGRAGPGPPGRVISGGFWPLARTSSSPLLCSRWPPPPSSPSLPPSLGPVPPTVTPQPPPERCCGTSCPSPPALRCREGPLPSRASGGTSTAPSPPHLPRR